MPRKRIKVAVKQLKFDRDGLIPAVIQDVGTGEVLMVAYMDEEALKRTIESGRTWFWSRSRQEYWCKGETSGNKQFVKEIRYDCDGDTLLVLVEQVGVACHTGHKSCFYRSLLTGEIVESGETSLQPIWSELFEVIKKRQAELPSGSYTAELFSSGLTRIKDKLFEEFKELIEASDKSNRQEVISESADLLYHLLVFLAAQNVSISEVERELRARRK